MSSEVKNSKKTQKQSEKNEIEITVLNTALEKNGKLLDDITDGKSIFEYMLQTDYINIMLENNGLDKNGNRYDLTTGLLISEKGNKVKPKNKKAKLQAEKDDDDLIH